MTVMEMLMLMLMTLSCMLMLLLQKTKRVACVQAHHLRGVFGQIAGFRVVAYQQRQHSLHQARTQVLFGLLAGAVPVPR